MAHVLIEVSGICNARCQMCQYPARKRPGGFMSLDLFKKIVDDVAANGHVIDWLHGTGETLMWPHLVEGVAYLRKKARTAGISTNGSLLTVDLARALHEAGQQVILVALDTADPAVYAKIRAGLDWRGVVKNVKEVARALPTLILELQWMPTRWNLHEGPRSILIPFLEDGGQFVPPNLVARPWSCVRLSSYNATRDMKHSPDDVPPSACDKLYGRVYVHWDGRASLCCLDAEGELLTGDANVESLERCFSGAPARNLRERILQGPAPDVCMRCFKDHSVLHGAFVPASKGADHEHLHTP